MEFPSERPILEQKSVKRDLGSDLVRISASWSCVETQNRLQLRHPITHFASSQSQHNLPTTHTEAEKRATSHMGRPPSNGGPAFRFIQTEVAEMEAILLEHQNAMPSREILIALADKFSESPDRKGKIQVQMKQVWNWFQNRRYAIRAKSMPASVSASSGRVASETTFMEFEAKSARDGAWYDVAAFLGHRILETGDAEVQVRFAGFGPEEDEWVNVKKHVRQRSLPCEASECVAVLPGDLILCFQEGKDQALYFDAHVLDAQRRRHDVRGCRCRFLVRYDHDQSEEIVPLRKVCRRPETDYRLHQLHAMNDSVSMDQQKTSVDISTANAPPRVISSSAEIMQKPGNANIGPAAPVSQAHVPIVPRSVTPETKIAGASNAINPNNPADPPTGAVATSVIRAASVGTGNMQGK
ncbi:hypothetical protein LWI29_010789 [Acer saccharum]|uniref:Homeobox domain-containing protein n=1 Tax=Acer saccharum TaxID=4024 RepID=A0AA39T1L7_ACESA|nr:hypothetical protein LWI29_010789 [Acer saccharum]